MAKWHGLIGFATQYETSPGVYQEKITESEYFGDVSETSLHYQAVMNSTNNRTILSKRIQIICDSYMLSMFNSIRYVTAFGSRWDVSNVSIEYPHIMITLGGLYVEQ